MAHLPPDIWSEIARHSQPRELMFLSLVNREIHEAVQESLLLQKRIEEVEDYLNLTLTLQQHIVNFNLIPRATQKALVRRGILIPWNRSYHLNEDAYQEWEAIPLPWLEVYYEDELILDAMFGDLRGTWRIDLTRTNIRELHLERDPSRRTS